MDITHLVVNGCSYTYCQGLDDPTTQGWPALIAKELGCEYVNLAIRGTGNDTIHRRTYEYVIENLPTNSKPFFIIAWTWYWRREAWFENWYGSPSKDYNYIQMPNNEKTENYYEDAMMENWNEEDFLRKTMLYKVSLKNLFKSYDVPYIMTDYHEENLSKKTIENVKERFSNFYKEFLKTNDFDNLRLTTLNTPTTPCQHTGYEGQQKIKEKMIEEISKKYGSINIINSDFLKLTNFPFSNKSNECFNLRSVYTNKVSV